MTLSAAQKTQLKAAGLSDADITTIDQGGAQAPKQPSAGGGLGAIAGGYQVAKATGLIGGGSGAASTAFPVASAVNGGTVMSDGSIVGAESGLGSIGSVALPALAAVYGTGQAIDTWKKASGKGIIGGAKEGLTIPHMLGTGIVGAPTLGAIAGAVGGKKSKVQQQRDTSRAATQNSGIADGNFNVTLADGSTYNIGADGHAMLKNVGKNIDGNTERHPYDVDFSNELAKNAIPSLNDLAKKILGESASAKQLSDMVGMLDNAVISNAKSQGDVAKNIAAISAKYNAPSGGSGNAQGPSVSMPDGTAAANAAIAGMNNSINQANAAATAAAKKSKLLGMVNTGGIITPKNVDYSGVLKNKYA